MVIFHPKLQGGNIGLLQDGDIIDIDIPNCSINVRLTKQELDAHNVKAEKAKGKNAWKPTQRQVSKSLKAYANMVSSADKGAVEL